MTKGLAHQAVLFEAKYGKEPSIEEMLRMKTVLTALAKVQAPTDLIAREACDQVVAKGCENVLQGGY